MNDEPNSEYQPLTFEPVRMTLIMDGAGETDDGRMADAQDKLRRILADRQYSPAYYGFNDVEAVEVVRDDTETEAERIRAACVEAIRLLEDGWIVPKGSAFPMKKTAIAKYLRSALGWPKRGHLPKGENQ